MNTFAFQDPATTHCRNERGSALVMAIFVLALLAAMGMTLLFVTENEARTGQVDQRAKRSFSLAEAGLEKARETMRVDNYSDVSATNRQTFNDELVAAAGANGVFDFSPTTLRLTYNSSGAVTGYTGAGDDVPVRAVTAFGSGAYAAFLTNDIADANTPLTDSNDRVKVTAVGAGENRSMEMVQAVLERNSFPPMPATITIVGPAADFDGGNSAAKEYSGDDCAIPGLALPAIGVFGAVSELTAEVGVRKPASYSEGAQTGIDTVDDVDGVADPQWQDCGFLKELARGVRASADVVGNSATPLASLGTPGNPRIVYIEGDYTLPGGFNGAGLLFVTGTLNMHGSANWYGTIFIVGDGTMIRSGAGNGDISGAILVADVSGPDRNLWTGDDCVGEDGILGTVDDGVAIGTYHVSGSGTAETAYCSSAISEVQERFPFVIVDFRQR